jgi:ABC-type antimicrobial peptide transport system permease subunit
MGSTRAAVFASVVGIFGLLLASMGIYSTGSYLVVIRTREMGIRLALGATKGHVVGLMLRQSLKPVVAGLLVGACLAMGGSYLLRKILYGLGTVDGVSYVGVSMAFLAIALLAAYFPSRRATNVDPVVALRCE